LPYQFIISLKAAALSPAAYLRLALQPVAKWLFRLISGERLPTGTVPQSGDWGAMATNILDRLAIKIGTTSESQPFTLHHQGEFTMATNNPRHGYERKRSQIKTKTMGQKHWTKRSRETGEFMDQKKSGKFKSVRREKPDR
jgi:hypothetical protein